jgi:uncharacterized protein
MAPSASSELLAIRDPEDRPHADLDWRGRLERLRAALAASARVVVAYSGGVDSSLLLAVAHAELGERSLGVIGVSDSYASHELALALDQARRIGARVETVTTGELLDPVFAGNPADRCYHCKTELYRRLAAVAAREGGAEVLDGTIADDLADWRPGRRAAAERGVRSPLAELGFRKSDVRAAAAGMGLASAGKPASPCLASRIPHGTPITRENLNQVERAESVLRRLGFDALRVRHHGEIARVEVPVPDLSRVLEPGVREVLVAELEALGFRWVVLDLEGLRSGNMNPMVSALRGQATRPADLMPARPPLGGSAHISGTVTTGSGTT